MRVQHLLSACGHAFDVTFVGPPPDRSEDREQVERLCANTVYLGDPPRDWRARWPVLREAAAVAAVARRTTVRMYEPFVAALQTLDLDAFDIIWAERVPIARLCRGASVRARTIVDLDDLEHVKMARQLNLNPGRARPRDLWRYARFRHWELKSSRKFLATLVCSKEDRDYLFQRGCDNAVCVPNGVDLPAPASTRRPIRAPSAAPRIVFVGNMDYEPNADGVAYFATDVLPRVRARLPDATFDVVGRGDGTGCVPSGIPGVRFRGFVEDLGAALGEYDMMVAPLRFGSGTKLKVLDAMAYRIPLVTTSVGAEGLLLEHREHALVADTAETLAEGICELANDAAFAERLAGNAYLLVRERFSWSAIQDRLVSWLQGLERTEGAVAFARPSRMRDARAV